MENNWREKKGLFFFLLAIASLIWGYNLYQIVVGVTGSEDDGLPAPAAGRPATVLSAETAEAKVYEGNFRDPFQHQLYVKKAVQNKKETPKKQNRKRPPRLPKLRLIGIVGGNGMIEVKNQTYFARVGDIIEGAKVLEIRTDQVVLEFQGEQHILRLDK